MYTLVPNWVHWHLRLIVELFSFRRSTLESATNKPNGKSEAVSNDNLSLIK